MIERLEIQEIEQSTGSEYTITERVPATSEQMHDKINELCDAVNDIQKEREAERFEIQEWIGLFEEVRKSVNVHKKQIGDLQNRITALDDPTYHEEPAENSQSAKSAQGFKNLQELAKEAEKECRFNPVQADREVYKALTRSENVQSGTESRSENVQELALVRKALDKGMEHITGLNNMIESWYKLLQSDKDISTKYAILKSAISAYVENKGGNNE